MDGATRWLQRLFLGVLLLFVALNLVSFCVSGPESLVNIFDDDAYYYFKIARNFTDGQGFTFDGQSLTNGFQPMWLLVLLPFFALISDSLLVLRFVGIFSSIIVGLAGYLGIRYLSRYSILPFTVGSAVLLFCLFSFGVTGMETAILLLVLTLAMLLFQRLKPWRPVTPSWSLTFSLTAALSLLLLARLDTIWLIGILLGGLLFFQSPLKSRTLWAIASGPLLTLVLYLGFNRIVFGDFMPTSGLAKSLNHQAPHLNTLFLWQMTHLDSPVTRNLWGAFAASCVFSIVYISFFGVARVKRRVVSPIDEAYVPLCIAVALLVFTAYQLFGTTWVLWRWYAYLLFPMGVFVFPHALELILQRLSRYGSFARTLRYGSLGLSILVLIQMSWTAVRLGYWSRYLAPAFRYDNYQLAESLNASLPPTAKIAMGDRAGSFGYFFHGRVLQLEGLVGDYQLIQALESNTLMDYMTDFGVDYVITYVAPPEPAYSQWTLPTPLPGFSTGPHADILLCADTEILRYGTPYETFYMWKWPSCSP